MSMFFDPPTKEDKRAEKKAIRAIMNACSKNDGIDTCKCSTDPDWYIDNIDDVTETFFCLPSECNCRDGSTEQIEPALVRDKN